MQVIQADYYGTQSAKNRIRLIELPAPRGVITDRHGEVLAEDRPVYDLVLVPQEVEDRERLFDVVSRELKISVNELRKNYRRGYRAPFAPVLLVSNLSKEQAIGFEERAFRLPGLFVSIRPARLYHSGESTAHLIGYLGEIDLEGLRRLKPYGYKMRDLVGKSGVEQTFDLELRGENGGTQIEVDHRGRMIRVLGHRAPIQGEELQLTLDASLQRKAASLLSGRRGAIVVIDPSTGDILAMVSHPGFDPNAFGDGGRQGEVKQWLGRTDSPFLNRALGAYTPGSIFKIITASAALEKGGITPQTSFDCKGVFKIGNSSFGCWEEEGHGSQNLTQALAHSCNVYFYRLGLHLGAEPLIHEAERWGIGRETQTFLSGGAPGLLPNPRWKKRISGQPWYDGDTLNLAIGQGYLLMSPLQAAGMIAVVANGGKLAGPHWVKRIGSQTKDPPAGQSIGVSQKSLEEIIKGLRDVVSDPTGTGQLAFSNQVSIAGKTGTAEIPQEISHAWFVGFAPVKNPKMAFAIFIEHGGSGGYAAAPVAKELVEHYLGER